jgi:hypothetical protein
MIRFSKRHNKKVYNILQGENDSLALADQEVRYCNSRS